MLDSLRSSPTPPSFEERIRRVLWILLGGMLVVAAGGVMSAWALSDAADEVDRAERARGALGGVLEGMVDQESGVRGFILTGQERFLETFGPGGALADSSRSDLRELGGELGRFAGLDDLDRAIDDWRTIAEEEIGLVRSGRPDEAVAIVESGAAKERFDLVRARIGEIDVRLDEIVESRNRRQVDLERVIALVGIVVLAGAVALIVATLRWVRRSVTQPLAALTGAVDRPGEWPLSVLADGAVGEVSALAHGADRLLRAKDIERSEAVLVAEQAERTRIAADLHDGPVQTLFAVQLRLQHLASRRGDEDELGRVLGEGIGVLDGRSRTYER